jgi:hypothetical protein
MSDTPKVLIIYIGKKQDSFDEMAAYFNNAQVLKSGYHFKKIETIEESIDIMLETPANAIFLDFSMLQSLDENYFKFLLLIKSFEQFSKTSIYGMFNDKSHLEKCITLYSVGLNYSYIRGNDLKQFLSNALYIITKNSLACLKYAKAEGFQLKAQCFVYSTLINLTSETITVDTDIKAIDDECAIDIRIFEDFKAVNFPMIEQEPGKTPLLGFYGTTYQIPFFGNLMEEESNTVYEDTYLNWLENHSDALPEVIPPMYFYTKNEDFVKEIFENKDIHLKYNIQVKMEFDNECQRISEKLPVLIVFDISDLPSYQNLTDLMTELSFWGENAPFVIIMGHKSASDALRKMYQYSKLISTTTKSSLKQILPIMGKVYSQVDLDKEERILRLNDPRAIARNILDIKITSFSENQITFITKVEIPFYAVLEFDIPINFHAVVVEPNNELAGSGKSFHYQAMLMNITEEDSSYLRTFVNHLLKSTPEKWEKNKEITLEQAPNRNQAQIETKNEEPKFLTNNNMKNKKSKL